MESNVNNSNVKSEAISTFSVPFCVQTQKNRLIPISEYTRENHLVLNSYSQNENNCTLL